MNDWKKDFKIEVGSLALGENNIAGLVEGIKDEHVEIRENIQSLKLMIGELENIYIVLEDII
jgi:hypothetical protein